MFNPASRILVVNSRTRVAARPSKAALLPRGEPESDPTQNGECGLGTLAIVLCPHLAKTIENCYAHETHGVFSSSRMRAMLQYSC